MSVRFGVPAPFKILHPELFLMGVLVSLSAILLSTVIVDKLGTAMFKRGFAKPFYIRGRRVHHRCIYLIVPGLYGIFLALYLLGYVQILWGSLYYNLAYTIGILALTMSVDFLGDKFWPKIRKNVILHHEWIYTLVPAYVLTYILIVVI
jgi:hypothetical protein